MADRVETDCDHNGTEFAQKRTETLNCLRDQAPLVYNTNYDGFWMALGHDVVRTVAGDAATFSSSREALGRNAFTLTIPPVEGMAHMTPIELDPPEHTAFRRILTSPFSKQAAREQLTPLVEQITDECIDKVLAQGRGDFIRDIASPVTTLATLIYLGIPTDEWERVARLEHDLIGFAADSPEFAAAAADLGFKGQLISEAIAKKRREPGDDVISYLMSQEIDGELLSDQTLHEVITLLIAGGVDTTTILIGEVLLYLDEHPELYDRILNEDEFWAVALEEFLRYFNPVTNQARTVTQPTELDGQCLAKGDRIFVSWFAANRDPKVFASPDELKLDRWPNPHATFGLSVHKCLGQHFARVEATVVIRKVLSRIPNYRIEREKVTRYPVQGALAGWSVLPFTLSEPAP